MSKNQLEKSGCGGKVQFLSQPPLIKGTVSRDFLLLVLFINQFPPSPRVSHRFKVSHRCQRHRWQMEKIFNQKNFNNFIWSPLGSRGNIYINFCLQVYYQMPAAWCCSNYLPPVSTTQGEIVAKFAAGVVDTGGKFAASVIDTGGNLPPVSLTLVANLPPVSLMHLELRSLQIFEKIRNDPNVIIRGLGEGDSWKKPEAKNLVTLSL